MKQQSILAAILFAFVATLPLGAQAAADADKAPATDMQAGKPMAKKMKPHSHVQEKTGMPQNTAEAAPEGKSGKLKADKDKSKHFHPRDGK